MLKSVYATGEHYKNDTETFMLRMEIARYMGKGGLEQAEEAFIL